MSQTIPEDRVRIFDRTGYPLVEFRASVSRSWAIAKEGRAQFTYSTRYDDIVNSKNLQFGNFLLVENSVLPSWVGVIDTPRSWDGESVTISAFTAERLFSYRRGADGERKLTGSAGTIFSEMIRVINKAELTPLFIGDIWTGGVQREETLTPALIIKNLKQLQARSLEEYDFIPIVQRGRLYIGANWKKQLGTISNLTLSQGVGGGNIEDAKAKEDGKIVNNIFGYGDGETWISKPQAVYSNETSIGTYGLRQTEKEHQGVTSITTVRNNNISALKAAGIPKWTFSLNALNVGSTFQFIQLGNYFRIALQSIGFGGDNLGFTGKARIMAMSYDPEIPNKIKIVLTEEYT